MGTMKTRVARVASTLATATVVIAASLGPTAGQTEEADTAAAKARQAVAELAANLKKSLGEALSSGGPAAAIAACQSIAPEAARTASQTHGLSVGRTALRLRNPANAPDVFERRVLEDFVSQIAGGADPEKLEHVEVVTDGSTRTLRFMKPIMMAEKPCAMCHGSAIAPEVKSIIQDLYPEDAATGFVPGELRGAFTVSMPLEGP